MSRRKQKPNVPVILAISGGVLLIIAALILASQSVTPTQTASVPQSSTSHEDETFPEIPRVSLVDSKAAFEAGTAVFLDVRDADSYATSRIPGALNIPLAEVESRLGELDKTQWIITYCTWPSEESSARAARILLDNGFENINPILGGFRAWQEEGNPIEEGI